MKEHAAADMRIRMETRDLSVVYDGRNTAVNRVNLQMYADQVTAVIGPSGCGKSTFIRCLNRMHDHRSDTRVSGSVLLDDSDIMSPSVDPIMLRRKVGMVFQKPTPFPTRSIFDNVAAGLSLVGFRKRSRLQEAVEKALVQAALFDEVKDRLQHSGGSLSVGQQQRLCIARALAVQPEVLLMDEPTSALDPVATKRIEDLISELKQSYTIIIVTHSMNQAARISDRTAFFLMGEVVEYDRTEIIFQHPSRQETYDYITGRIG